MTGPAVSTPNRIPAGVPAGGQYAAAARHEPTALRLVDPQAPPDPDALLDDLVPGDRALVLDRETTGSEIFDEVRIERVAGSDHFAVTGIIRPDPGQGPIEITRTEPCDVRQGPALDRLEYDTRTERLQASDIRRPAAHL